MITLCRRLSSKYLEIRSSYDLSDDIMVVVGLENTSITPEVISEHLQARLRVRPEVIIKEKTEVINTMQAAGGRKLKRFFDLRRTME